MLEIKVSEKRLSQSNVETPGRNRYFQTPAKRREKSWAFGSRSSSPEGRQPPCYCRLSSRSSHNFAAFQSRLQVVTEMSSSSAISSCSKP
jgi:hypothetical protein